MGRKERHEERLDRGDEVLESRGVDLDAPDEVLLPALVAAIGVDPDADLSIADLLGSVATEESARRLAEWELRRPADKDLLREIRRSLFRLQQRGVAAAARPAPEREPVRLAASEEPGGWLSPLDSEGSRFAWLSRPRTEGGLTLLCAVLSDQDGMRHVDARVANKAQWKQTQIESARHGSPLVEAPGRYVDWLMAEAYRRGVPRDEGAGGYPLLRADFYTRPAEPAASSAQGMIGDLTAEEEERLLEASDRLLGRPELAGWMLPHAIARLHQARFADARDSTLVLTEDQVARRLESIIDQAFDEIFEGEGRALYAGRMLEMTLWFALSGQAEAARICRAVGGALSDPSRRLRGIPFLKGLVLRSFQPLMPAGARPRPDASGDPPPLIVTPE